MESVSIESLEKKVRSEKSPRPPSEIAKIEIPKELDAIVLKCLQKKPEDRYGSVGQVAKEIADAFPSLKSPIFEAGEGSKGESTIHDY